MSDVGIRKLPQKRDGSPLAKARQPFPVCGVSATSPCDVPCVTQRVGSMNSSPMGWLIETNRSRQLILELAVELSFFHSLSLSHLTKIRGSCSSYALPPRAPLCTPCCTLRATL